jgi:hypothetical protein
MGDFKSARRILDRVLDKMSAASSHFQVKAGSELVLIVHGFAGHEMMFLGIWPNIHLKQHKKEIKSCAKGNKKPKQGILFSTATRARHISTFMQVCCTCLQANDSAGGHTVFNYLTQACLFQT